MNKTNIEWADFTYNPIVGCRNACGATADNPTGWCYARRLATTRLAHLCPKCATFEPHLHYQRLGDPWHVKQPALIFADSMSDWWSPGVEMGWRHSAFLRMLDAEQHRFVVLTKRPDLIHELDARYWPSNAWLGVSITSGEDWWRWEALANLPERIHKLISVEPLLGPGVGAEFFREQEMPEWVIVGPQSGANAVAPDPRWQDMIRFGACSQWNIPLFEKPGLLIQPAVRQMPHDLAMVFRKGL